MVNSDILHIIKYFFLVISFLTIKFIIFFDGKGWEGMGRDGKGWVGMGRDGKGMGRDMKGWEG